MPGSMASAVSYDPAAAAGAVEGTIARPPAAAGALTSSSLSSSVAAAASAAAVGSSASAAAGGGGVGGAAGGAAASGPTGMGRVALQTLDEPVSTTIMRDLRMVGSKLSHVLVPRGSGGAAQEDTLRALRDWDLWGPLLLCLVLARYASHYVICKCTARKRPIRACLSLSLGGSSRWALQPESSGDHDVHTISSAISMSPRAVNLFAMRAASCHLELPTSSRHLCSPPCS